MPILNSQLFSKMWSMLQDEGYGDESDDASFEDETDEDSEDEHADHNDGIVLLL